MRVQVHGANPVDPGTATTRPGAGRRRLPRGLLLDDQPRHLRPARPRVAAGRPRRRWTAGWSSSERDGRPSSAPCRSATCGPATRSSAARTASGSSCRRRRRAARRRTSGSCPRRCPARSRRRCSSARSPSGCARSRPPGKRILWVGGPAVVHTGAAPAMVAAGATPATSTSCSPATRWPRTTSSPRCSARRSGVDLAKGSGVPHGHEHHIRAINTIRAAGSIAAAVESGRAHRRRHARDGAGRTSRSCWSARCATTARCPTSTPT